MKFDGKNIAFGVLMFAMVLGIIGLGSAVVRITDTDINANGIALPLQSCVVSPTSDSYTQLQDCIDAVGDNSEIKVLYGTYVISAAADAVSIHNLQNVTIVGEAGTKIIAGSALQDANLLNITSSKNIRIKGIHFDGGNYTDYILFAWHDRELYFDDVKFTDPTSDSNGALEFYNVTDAWFTDSYLENIWIFNIFGWSTRIHIIDNTCLNSYDSCWSIGDSAGRAVSEIQVLGNMCNKTNSSTGYCYDLFGLVRQANINDNTAAGKGFILNDDRDTPKYVNMHNNVAYGVNANAFSVEENSTDWSLIGNIVNETYSAYSDFNIAGSNGVFIGNVFNPNKLSVTGSNIKRGLNSDASMSGFTATGNINMGANLLQTSNHALKDSASYLQVRTSNDAGYSSMQMQNANIQGNVIGGGNQIYGYTWINATTGMSAPAFVTASHRLKTDGTRLAVRTANDAGYSSMIMQDAYLYGELLIGGVTGSGKAVCVKADGYLGVCGDAVGAGGTCTCS